MNKEEYLLKNICKCFLEESAPYIDSDINWQKFFVLAKNHNLIGVCHCVFNKDKALPVPQDTRNIFMDNFFDTVYIFNQQSIVLDEIKKLFAKAEIPFVIFKGAVLRELYSTPEARSMGDIDLLIADEDKDKAKKIMLDIGFLCDCDSGTVREYSRNGICVEVHTKLTDKFGEEAFSNAMDNCAFNDFEGTFDDSYHFAYLIAHTAIHVKYTGAGIRLVLDLAVMLKNRSIDLNKVLEFLQPIGLEKFGKMLLSLCFKWFGYGKCYYDNTDKLEEYLIQKGIFGSLKTQEENTVSRLVQCEALENESHNAFARKLKVAFPPYKTMRNTHYINFLDGKPWLLPVAWVYRFFYNIKNTPSNMINTVKNLDDEKTTILAKQELEFFKEIGLQ